MKKQLYCPSIPLVNMPASHGIKVNEWIFISGMTGLSSEVEGQPPSFYEQASCAMRRLLETARQGGIGADGLLKCNVYLKDMSTLPEFEHAFLSCFPTGVCPAGYAFEMPSLLGGQEVVVEAFGRKAVREEDRFQAVCVPELAPVRLASHGIKTGNFIFTSAIPPANTKMDFGDMCFDDQVRSAIENMIRVVECAGGAQSDIVKVVVFLKDLNLFDHFNGIYREYFNRDTVLPARSCFGVSTFQRNCAVSLECTAYTGSDQEVLCSPCVPFYDLPFCQGIRAEDMVFLSGQVGCDKTRGMPGTFEGQMQAVFHNMFSIAKEAGATAENFVRTTGYLVDEADLAEFLNLYRTFWKEPLPASVIFKPSGISYDYALEIDSHVCLDRG